MKTVVHMKTVFSNISAAAFRENGTNVTVFTQGNRSIKPKSLEGRKGKLRRPEDTLVFNMRGSNKWHVACYSVMSGSTSHLCMISCCSAFVICFVGLSVFHSLSSCVDGWRLYLKIATEEKVFKTYYLCCVKAILNCLGCVTVAQRYDFLEVVIISR